MLPTSFAMINLTKNLKSVSEREKKLVAFSFAMINFTKNLMSIFVKTLKKMMVATSSNNLGSGIRWCTWNK